MSYSCLNLLNSQPIYPASKVNLRHKTLNNVPLIKLALFSNSVLATILRKKENIYQTLPVKKTVNYTLYSLLPSSSVVSLHLILREGTTVDIACL